MNIRADQNLPDPAWKSGPSEEAEFEGECPTCEGRTGNYSRGYHDEDCGGSCRSPHARPELCDDCAKACEYCGEIDIEKADGKLCKDCEALSA